MAGPMTRQLGSAVSAATYSRSKTSILPPIYKHTQICTESDYIKSKPDVVMARCQKCLLLYAQPAGARTATRSVGAGQLLRSCEQQPAAACHRRVTSEPGGQRWQVARAEGM